MGKFKFSKKAYLKEIKEKRDWEPGRTEPEKERPDVNKTMRCYKFAGGEGAAITVEIKAGKCDLSYQCLASPAQCKFR